MKFYAITKGQLTTIWIFGIILWIFAVSSAGGYEPSSIAQFSLILIPGVLIFYTIGWKNENKEKRGEYISTETVKNNSEKEKDSDEEENTIQDSEEIKNPDICPKCGTETNFDDHYKCHNCNEPFWRSMELFAEHIKNIKERGEDKNIANDIKGEITSKKISKRTGLIIVLSSFLGLIIIFSSYAIVNTVLGGVDVGGETDARAFITKILRFALTSLGIIAVLSFWIGIIIMIIGNSKKYNGKKHILTAEEHGKLKKWNWGAAGLGWIWGIYFNVWASLLAFLPLVSLFMWLILGINGNEWAWQKGEWKNYEEFEKAQKKWKPWGIAFLLLPALVILGILLVGMVPKIIDAPRRAEINKENSAINNTNPYSSISGEKVNYAVDYNPKKWTVKKETEGEAEYTFTHTDGDVYAMLIPERAQIPMNGLENAAMINAKSVAPDAKVTYREEKTINNEKVLILEIRGTVEGIPLIYLGYYFSGSYGAIQFVTYTTPNLYDEYKNDMNELLNGLK